MTEELKEVLRKWLEDATSAEPSRGVKFFGLCYFVRSTNSDVEDELNEILVREFANNYSFPFNIDDEDYVDQKGYHHLNKDRRDWVRSKLAEPSVPS